MSDINCDDPFPIHADLSVTDNCVNVTVAKDTLPFTFDNCQGYVVTYRWIATDDCGNKDTATVSFNVLPDTEDPQLASPVSLSDINCDDPFPIHADLSVTDNCVNASVAKDTLPFIVDNCQGYVVTYRWIATDDCGNMDTATVSFNVLPDTEAPMCPSDWDQQIAFDTATCTLLDVYPDIQSLLVDAPDLIDNCSDPTTIDFDLISEILLPAVCMTDSDHFTERTVVRTYQFTDQCGNTSDPCEQVINYQISECKGLTGFGSVAINGETTVMIPSGCNPPPITPTTDVQGACGYVEYMWLVSTQTDPNGNPLVFTEENLGTVWFIIPGADKEYYDPGTLTETTFFIRCARNFSCCDFGGESNMVAFRIDPNAVCPINTTVIEFMDCDKNIFLLSPENDYEDEEEMMFVTDMNIEARNQISNQSRLLLKGGMSSKLVKGFSVMPSAQLEIYNEGCPDD